MGEKSSVIPIVRFAHADLKDATNLTAHLERIKVNKQKKSAICSQNGDHHHHHRSKRLKLTVKHEDMVYEGVEEDDSQFILGLVSDEDEPIRLIDTSYFVLKPECCVTPEENGPKSTQETSYSDKLNLLTAAFGSSKKRRAMQTKLKNKIDSSSLEVAVDAAVKETLSTVNQEDENEPGVEPTEEFSVLPTPNPNAKSPQEVYDLHELLKLTQDEFDRFTNDCAVMFAEQKVETVKEWSKSGAYPEYVCDRLLSIGASKLGHKHKMNKFKLLAIINYLLNMFKMKQSQLKSRSCLTSAQVPDAVVNKLYQLYTISSGGKGSVKIPNRLRDKLAAHILIVALNIDDFSTDYRPFQRDMKMSLARLGDFYLGLGCYIGNQIAMDSSGKRVMTKKADLKLPINRVTRLEPKKRTRKNA